MRKFLLLSIIFLFTYSLFSQNDSLKLNQLENVYVYHKKFKTQLVLGTFQKSDLVSSLGNLSKNPLMEASYFEYKDIYKKTPYILSVKLATISKVKEAQFYVNFYSIKSDSKESDKKLLKEGILVSVEKGKKITEIDLSDENIKFPKTGLLVTVQQIYQESNIGPTTKLRFEEEKRKLKSLEPSFRTVKRDETEYAWRFFDDSWKRNDFYEKFYIERSKTKLAVELTLTD